MSLLVLKLFLNLHICQVEEQMDSISDQCLPELVLDAVPEQMFEDTGNLLLVGGARPQKPVCRNHSLPSNYYHNHSHDHESTTKYLG